MFGSFAAENEETRERVIVVFLGLSLGELIEADESDCRRCPSTALEHRFQASDEGIKRNAGQAKGDRSCGPYNTGTEASHRAHLLTIAHAASE